jgi:tRNA G46 methylase TrmB
MLNYQHIEREHYLLPPKLDHTNSSYIYGEVNHKQIVQLLREIDTDIWSSFADIGSGCGKMVIYVALEFPDKYCSGIEIHEQRHECACSLLEEHDSIMATTEFRCDDFMKIYFGNYDIIYCCNIIFSKEDNKKLYKKLLTEFSGYAILFNYDYDLQRHLIKKLQIDTSWEKKVNLYLFYIP